MRALTRPADVPIIHWVQAARLKFIPQGVLPIAIGGAAAFSNGVFNLTHFIIALFAAAAVQIALTMFNDTLDFQYGTDRCTVDVKNPYSGGSGVLTSGCIRPKQAMTVIIGLYTLALFAAIYFAFSVGILSLGLAAAGAAISIMYSAKPFRLAYRGLGELAMLIGYGPIVTVWGYYVHAGTFTPEILLAGIVPGLSMWTMIIINEIPDHVEDRAAGKKNLTYRLGPRHAKNLFIISLVSIYIYVMVLVLASVIPFSAMLALIGLPFAFLAGRAAHRHFTDSLRVAEANKFMVVVYSVTNAAIALGFLLG